MDNIRYLRKLNGWTQKELAERLGVGESTISQYENGHREPDTEMLLKLAEAFDTTIDYLLRGHTSYAPEITEDTVTLGVLGDVAAGYGRIATADLTGEQIEIPREWLHGRPASDYFALRVIGGSMYPLYMDGDIVIVLRQSTMNRSGEIGVVVYEDELATLKKIEYVTGEDWMRLLPVNPNYEPIMVEGEDLTHCRVLGIPVKLIRDIKQ